MKAHNLNDVRSTMSSSDFDLYVCKKLVAKERNARERGIEFGMTFSAMRNILRAKRCFYTGIEIILPLGEDHLKANSLTLDRIDSSKGYVSGNVVACSNEFNNLKARVDSAGKFGMQMMVKAFSKAEKRFT